MMYVKHCGGAERSPRAKPVPPIHLPDVAAGCTNAGRHRRLLPLRHVRADQHVGHRAVALVHRGGRHGVGLVRVRRVVRADAGAADDAGERLALTKGVALMWCLLRWPCSGCRQRHEA
eukprot:365137-Chlamydomonas_euryale.AAC.11